MGGYHQRNKRWIKMKLKGLYLVTPDHSGDWIINATERAIKSGVDVGIVKIGDKYMAVTTDPLYIDKSFGFKKAAWFAFHILSSHPPILSMTFLLKY